MIRACNVPAKNMKHLKLLHAGLNFFFSWQTIFYSGFVLFVFFLYIITTVHLLCSVILLLSHFVLFPKLMLCCN